MKNNIGKYSRITRSKGGANSIWDKVRKPVAKPTSIMKDRSKYSRKEKHRQKQNES